MGLTWSEFSSAAPQLAALGAERFQSTGLCLLATLRADGWPRISPCEFVFEDGELLLGMMWQSRKAHDLLRDPRLSVHSTQCDKNAAEGDFKLYGRARDIPDDGVDPTRPRPSHLFAVEVEGAAYISFTGERVALHWDQQHGLRRLPHPADR